MEAFQSQLDMQNIQYHVFKEHYPMIKQSFITTMQKQKQISILGNVEVKFIILTH